MWSRPTAPRVKIYCDGLGALRITALLLDSATGRYVWADRSEGDYGDLFVFQERTAERIAQSVEQVFVRQKSTVPATRSLRYSMPGS